MSTITKNTFLYLAVCLFQLVWSNITIAAEVPGVMQYEGYLSNAQGIALTDGKYKVQFKIYDTATGGAALWSESWNALTVTKGHFRVLLGTQSPLTSAFFQQHPTTYLGITVGTDAEMLPRQKIASVPYALSSPGSSIPAGGIIMWSGAINAIPNGWALCDGNNGTPDLRDRFVVGAGNLYSVGTKGGAASVTLNISQIPAHNHSGTTGGHSADHSHSGTLISKNESGTSGSRVREADNSGANGGISYQTNGASNNHTHDFTTSTIGGNSSHENRPPYYALAYIMKL